jgi:hypothetical protein
MKGKTAEPAEEWVSTVSTGEDRGQNEETAKRTRLSEGGAERDGGSVKTPRKELGKDGKGDRVRRTHEELQEKERKNDG